MSRIIKKEGSQKGNSLPIIGKIKIGEKKTTAEGKEYPSALDYFRVPDECKFKDLFKKAYGDKPKKLKVVFVSDNIDEVCAERYECWDKGKRWGWGDGEHFEVYDGKDYIQVDKVKAHELTKGKKWETFLTLRFVLPEIPGVLGQWQFDTKGAKVTIPSIVSSFDFVRERANTIVAIPFELVVEPTKGYSPGAARNYPVVKLVPNISDESIQKVREWIGAGKSMSDVATLVLTEKNINKLDAPTITTDAVVIESKIDPSKT